MLSDELSGHVRVRGRTSSLPPYYHLCKHPMTYGAGGAWGTRNLFLSRKFHSIDSCCDFWRNVHHFPLSLAFLWYLLAGLVSTVLKYQERFRAHSRRRKQLGVLQGLFPGKTPHPPTHPWMHPCAILSLLLNCLHSLRHQTFNISYHVLRQGFMPHQE